MKKKLVCYFSVSGRTKKVAFRLANCLQADLMEIQPLNLYTLDDLDWKNPNSRSSREMNDVNSRPEIKKQVINMDMYEQIFIGYPIWWGLAPRIINTFIEDHHLEDKDIYIFATSGGSSIQYSFEHLKESYPDLHFIDAKLMSDTMTDEELKF